MQLTAQQDGISAFYLLGRSSVAGAQDMINALRAHCGQHDDILTSPQVMLANTARWGSYPVVAVLRAAGQAYGALLLHGGCAFGLPTGVLRAGHLCGRGAVIGQPSERLAVAETAARLLVTRRLVHTVIARVGLEGAATVGHDGWHRRPMNSCIDLEGGQTGLAQSLGYKLRRNISNYRRKAERESGCIFWPSLSIQESTAAVRELLQSNRHTPQQTGRALRYEGALNQGQHSIAMGLRDWMGRWLSYVAGWRVGSTLYVEWQINSARHLTASLSTVMRGYLLDHEISLGTHKVVFVGGTTELWSRACQQGFCADLIICSGIAGSLTRSLSARLRPSGDIAELHSRSAKEPSCMRPRSK